MKTGNRYVESLSSSNHQILEKLENFEKNDRSPLPIQ